MIFKHFKNNQLTLFYLINGLILINGQSDLLSSIQSNTASASTYIGLVCLLFVFTIFGLLTAFLIRHKPKNHGSSRNKDIEAELNDEKSSKDLINSYDQTENDDVTSFDFIDQKSNNSKIRFLANPYDSPSNQNQPYRSSESTNELTKLSDLTSDDDYKSIKTTDDDQSIRSPEIQEIPKDPIATAESVTKDDELSEPIAKTTSFSLPSNNDKENTQDKQTVPNDVSENAKIEDDLNDQKDVKLDDLIASKSDDNSNELKNEKENEPKLENENENENAVDKDLEIPEKFTFPSVTDLDSIKSGRSMRSYHSFGFTSEELPSTSKKSDIRFDDELNSDPTIRWHKLYDNMKLEKPSDYDRIMKNMSQPNNSPIRGDDPSKFNSTLEEISEDDSLNYLKIDGNVRDQNLLKDKVEKSDSNSNELEDKKSDQKDDNENQNDEVKQEIEKDQKDDQASLKSEKSTGSKKSNKYEFLVIKAPPLNPDDPNAKYVEKTHSEEPINSNVNTNQSDSTKSSSPDLDPSTLIRESLLDESDSSNAQSPNQEEIQQETQQNASSLNKNQPKSNETIRTSKSLDQFDETASLVTLNSVDTSFVDYSIPATNDTPKLNTTKLNTGSLPPSSSNSQPSSQFSTQLPKSQLPKSELPKSKLSKSQLSKSQLSKPQLSKPQSAKSKLKSKSFQNQKRTSKSVLDVLERKWK